MTRYKTWILTDVLNDVWLDSFAVGNDGLPADYVAVRVNLDPPHELSVLGHVLETGLFYPHLHLTTTCTTVPGSNRLVLHDVVQNLSAEPAEMEMLYHCNLGPPFLEAG